MALNHAFTGTLFDVFFQVACFLCGVLLFRQFLAEIGLWKEVTLSVGIFVSIHRFAGISFGYGVLA